VNIVSINMKNVAEKDWRLIVLGLFIFKKRNILKCTARFLKKQTKESKKFCPMSDWFLSDCPKEVLCENKHKCNFWH